MAGAVHNEASDSSESDDSVTDIGAPAVVRIPSLKIERGAVLAGRYQVEAGIGKGGSGIVLRAFDRVTQVPVAIKLLNPELARDPKWLERFSRELRLARQIQHPNVCRVFDIDEADGHWFLTMELAGAGTLRDSLLASNAPKRTPEQKLADARAALAGLTAIHGAQIIHRDIKPENFLRMEDGRLVISDFGLAAVRSESNNVTIMVGTPSYMAPEIVMGEPATARSDVWSLGVVLHEIFFGRRPVWESKGHRSRRLVVPDQGLTSDEEKAAFAMCQRCVADDPLERPADAGEVARGLEQPRRQPVWLRGGPRSWRLARRTGLVFALVISSLLVVSRRHLWSRAEAIRTNSSATVVVPEGSPADWGRIGKVLASLDGRVHCVSTVNRGRAARVIWGSPRRAEDLDLTSGARAPAPLSSVTFKAGCPELSPSGQSLLFTAYDEMGAAQIRVSDDQRGEPSRFVTSGYEPTWMANGQEFLYTIDSAHSAVFSLPTMTFTLLPDDDLEGTPGKGIVDKAVNAAGDRIALLRVDDRANGFVSIYSSPGMRLLRTFRMSTARKVDFDPRTNHLLVSTGESATASTVVELDIMTAKAESVGLLPGVDVLSSSSSAGERVVAANNEADDVWLYDSAGRRKLTDDGANVTAAMAGNGALLIGRRSADGKYVIWAFGGTKPGRQITSGPDDVAPTFSPDGDTWAYVDYQRTSIMACNARTNECRVARRDAMLPAWPAFSPDGSRIAYLTQLSTPRLFIVPAARDGEARDLGPALPDCQPVWSSSDRIWVHEKTTRGSCWAERDALTGVATGKQLEFPAGVEVGKCWWPDAAPGSPFFRRVRVERREYAKVLSVGP